MESTKLKTNVFFHLTLIVTLITIDISYIYRNEFFWVHSKLSYIPKTLTVIAGFYLIAEGLYRLPCGNTDDKKPIKIARYFSLIFLLMLACVDIFALISVVFHPETQKFSTVYNSLYCGIIAYILGILTALSYEFCKAIFPKIKDKMLLLIVVLLAVIIFVFFNTFINAPFFTGIYCLLGGFAGSELISCYKNRKKAKAASAEVHHKPND